MAGRITAAEAQKRNPNRVSISVDGDYLGSVEDIVWVQSRLKVGDTLSDETWQAMQGRQEEQAIQDRALNHLAARARSTGEMRKFLTGKGHDADAVERVLEKLTNLGYLDDGAFAGMFVRDRVNLKGTGRRTIAAELRLKGVDEQTTAEALEEYLPEDEENLALTHAQKALRLTAREADPRKRRAKIYASLARKGFSQELIQRVVYRMLSNESDDND